MVTGKLATSLPSKTKTAVPGSGDGRSRFTVRLGSSPADRPAYNAERDANHDEQMVQRDRHIRSMSNPARISKYNYPEDTINCAYERVSAAAAGRLAVYPPVSALGGRICRERCRAAAEPGSGSARKSRLTPFAAAPRAGSTFPYTSSTTRRPAARARAVS